MTALYKQAKRLVVESIRSGEFGVGDLLPPVHELAPRLRHTPATVRKALVDLANDHVVRRIPRRGTIVVDLPRTGRVCLLLSRDSHLNGLLAEPVYSALLQAGFDVNMVPFTQDSRTWIDECRRLRSQRQSVDQLVSIQAALPHDSFFDALMEGQAMFPRRVLFSQLNQILDPQAHLVSIDHRQEARDVADHLLALGHQRIAMPVEDTPGWTHDLSETFRHLLEVAGATFIAAPGPDPGMREIEPLVRKHGATAFWGTYDHQALLVMNEVHRLGLGVPQDVSVVGRNDTPWSLEATSPITSVSLNPPAIAKAIADAALAQALGEDAPGQLSLIKPRLIVRRSTGPAPQTRQN